MTSASGFRRDLTRFANLAPVRWAGWVALAFLIFALVLLLNGRDPIRSYTDVLANTLGNSYGISEVVAKMIPLVLAALAVAVPARIGLVNVGGESQLYMGAWLASWGALSLGGLPAWLLLPLMTILGIAGGGLWAGSVACCGPAAG